LTELRGTFSLLIAHMIFAVPASPGDREGLLPVALVAAIVSYRHMSVLLAFCSEDPITRIIGPARRGRADGHGDQRTRDLQAIRFESMRRREIFAPEPPIDSDACQGQENAAG